MSSFKCDKCGTECVDTEYGYVTGCEHYPHDCQCADRIGLCILCAMRGEIKAEGGDIDRVLRHYEVRRISAPSQILKEEK